ncbi:reverse transcriptase domain-containing protein [Tanacetum coccineum]
MLALDILCLCTSLPDDCIALRIRDELANQNAETTNLTNKLDREIHGLRAQLEAAKYDVIKYCIGTLISISAVGLATIPSKPFPFDDRPDEVCCYPGYPCCDVPFPPLADEDDDTVKEYFRRSLADCPMIAEGDLRPQSRLQRILARQGESHYLLGLIQDLVHKPSVGPTQQRIRSITTPDTLFVSTSWRHPWDPVHNCVLENTHHEQPLRPLSYHTHVRRAEHGRKWKRGSTGKPRRQEKLKEIKARLNFEEPSQHSESGASSRRRDLRKKLDARRVRNTVESPEQRRERSISPRRGNPEIKTVSRRLEKGVFHRLGDKDKSVRSNNSEYRPHHGSHRETESCYQSSRSKGTKLTSGRHRYKRSPSREDEELSESDNNKGGHWKSRSKKQRSNIEDDDLAQPWVCEKTDPCTPRIRYFDLPKRTRMPSHVKTYDGSEDPEDHLKIFQAAAKVERWAMPTWCHMFNSTLIGSARVWFDDLPPEPVYNYNDLKEAFLANFRQQKKCIKDPIELAHIKDVKGASEVMRISEFMHGITNLELIKRLHDNIPKSVEEMMKIKELHKAGKLSHLIKDLKQNRVKDQPKAAKKGETSSKDKALTILMVRPWHKVARQKNTQSFSFVSKISFPPIGEEEGTEGPMIIEAEVGGHFTHRMYVDRGASSEIMYEHCINIPRPKIRSQMVLATTYLIGFNGEIIWPMGQIALMVKIGDEEHSTSAMMNFMVFPVEGGVLTLKRSRIVLLECAMVSGPEGQPATAEQPAEERIKVAIHPEYLEQTVSIGSTLREESRGKLCDLLKRNWDVFDWKPADMTGQASERNKAIQEEAEKLVDAGIMNEVHYHSWLANPVMVKKHDGSWRMCVDFKDLNKACPKDGYPLPKIDWKVESLCGYPFKCFLDAYKGYHQIKMPQNLKVYVDDLVIKSRTEDEIMRDMVEMFRTLKEINMKLNPKKCTFGVEEGMFIGCLKDVQKLSGKLASLNRFLAKYAEKSLPIFKTLKKCTKKSDFHWTAEAEDACKQMKRLIADLPTLTTPMEKEVNHQLHSGSKRTESAVQQKGRGTKQMPIYFVSRALRGPKINYMQMEKLVSSGTRQQAAK